MDWIGAILVIGSVIFSGLYGYTVVDAIRTIRVIGRAESLRAGKEMKIGYMRVGFGQAFQELFWPAAIILLTIPDPATEGLRQVVFIAVWLVSGVIRLVFWMRMQ